ncbi:hypothetical protein ABH920_002380 [Catenulispora sp. EB89]|uniref:Ser-Thr-rich GPI-anchored membrane family protein n=1 Tax=Catenulispora sp. EB89 TaxID=3156257 RepID=UPI003516C23B
MRAEPMSLGKNLGKLDAKVDESPSKGRWRVHSASTTLPTADRLEITYPGDDAVWSPAEEIDVTWDLRGDVQRPLDVTLVRQTGDRSGPNFGRLAFFTLARGVDPAEKKVTIEVPDVPPGGDYAISISSADPLTVYSRVLTIAEPEPQPA